MTKAPTAKAPKAAATPAKAEAKTDAKAAAPKKASAPKKAAAEAPPKGAKVEKPKAGAKPNALQQPMQPSADLAAVVGEGTMARGEVVSKVWEYIRAHNLQNPENKQEILADDKLKKVFGKDRATMFEMNKFFSAHLTKLGAA